MRLFKVSKDNYKFYTQYDIYDIESGLIFFRFESRHHYYTDIQCIQCSPEWEEYKELLANILKDLNTESTYECGILLRAVREAKLDKLGIV